MTEDQAPPRRLPRAQRRDQILAAATGAFARTGFADTSLDDVSAAAGVSKAILYRHFESKTELYRAVLDRVCAKLDASVGTDDHDDESIPTLMRAAAADPDGFRLLFRYAAREPEFRSFVDAMSGESTRIALRQLTADIPDPRWAGWAAQLAPVITIEATLAWLDAGQPDPELAAERVKDLIAALITTAATSGEVPSD